MDVDTTDLAPDYATQDERLPTGPDDVPPELEQAGIISLVRDFADDTRTLIQQEIELAKMEAAATAKRVAIDSAWIGAGVFVISIGALCLIFALALGVGALLDSYWLGALITGVVLFLLGALFAWKGIRDLKKGNFAPSDTLDTLQGHKEWAEQEVDDLKQALRKESP